MSQQATLSRKKLRDRIQRDYESNMYGEGDEDKFQQLYEKDVAATLIQQGHSEERTIIHYLLRKLEGDEFDQPYISLLVKLSLKLMSIRFTRNGLSDNPPVFHNALEYGREERLEGFVRLICESGYENIIQGAIATTNDHGESALHIAINGRPLNQGVEDNAWVPANICVIDMLMEHSNEKAFMAQRKSDGNMPLHDLAHYRHCCVRPRACGLDQCVKCRSSVSQVTRSFIQTLKNVIKKYPAALHAPNRAGKTPYVIHLETRRLACEGKLQGMPKHTQNRSSWDELEYEAEIADKQKLDITNKSSIEKNDWTLNEKQIAIEISRLLLEECFSQTSYDHAKTSLFGKSQKHSSKQTSFIPQEALNSKTRSCHEFLPLHSILTKVEVHLSNDMPLKAIQDAGMSQQASFTNSAISPSAITNNSKRKIREHNERYLVDVMRWLRDTKKVKRILKFVVRDNQLWQCRDEIIVDVMKGWDIRYLDWNKSDMALDTIEKSGANKVVELCLTSSGSNAALIGWSDPKQGLGIFPKLRTVNIRMRSEFESQDRRSDCQRNFETLIKERFEQLDVKVYSHVAILDGFEGDTDAHAKGEADGHRLNRWMQAIKDFVPVIVKLEQQAKDYPGLEDRLQKNRIKIALIDDGVNPQNLSQIHCLKHGKGWPDGDEPYYRSSEEHGTIMAKLILEVCPYVDIYVARLDKSAQSDPKYNNSVAEMAAQAVKWAIEQDVDIISMSWTIKKTVEKTEKEAEQHLIEQIEAAGKTGNDIILFCAAEDEGEYGEGKSLPASTKSAAIKRIGSSNLEGKASAFLKEDHVEFLFPGEDILTDASWPLKDGRKRQGSSASTALASGLAALILWCVVVAGNEKMEYRREQRLFTLFHKLKSTGQKFVDITKILKAKQHGEDPMQVVKDLVSVVDGLLRS